MIAQCVMCYWNLLHPDGVINDDLKSNTPRQTSCNSVILKDKYFFSFFHIFYSPPTLQQPGAGSGGQAGPVFG